MSSASGPSTPSNIAARTVSADAPPGTWRHPRFDEINRRLGACTFDAKNVKSIAINAIAFLIVFIVTGQLSFIVGLSGWLGVYASYVVYAIRVIPLANIFIAVSPLIRHKDNLEDIALTPNQRALLGLGPAAQASTPGSLYVTPPRYSRSSTPHTGSTNRSDASFSSRGSPFSPAAVPSANNSPLFQRALARDGARNAALASPSPLSLNRGVVDPTASLLPATPSPTTTRGASIGLNSKWLYEKRRSSSRARSPFS